jgi:hypothetical protein
LSAWTITGTVRSPLEYLSICCSPAWSLVTLMYLTGAFPLPYASRAAVVWGQLSLPKIKTVSDMRVVS